LLKDFDYSGNIFVTMNQEGHTFAQHKQVPIHKKIYYYDRQTEITTPKKYEEHYRYEFVCASA